VSLAVVGLFTTALFLTHFLGQVPAGRLIDRHGARRVGLGALAIVAVANALALTGSAPGDRPRAGFIAVAIVWALTLAAVPRKV